MTILSFRIGDAEAAHLQAWSKRLGFDRSEVIREAVRTYLNRLASEHDAAAWEVSPLDDSELAVGEAADWAPAEDWSDWADAAR